MRPVYAVTLSILMLLGSLTAQQNPANATVPPLIQFSNVATDEGGNTLSGVVNITFSLYSGQQGGEPLWTETQNDVQLDPTGHYSVQLGITKRNGVPMSLFNTGEARWLGVRTAEQTEQARVLLLSVPYALKAGDAATIGGLPPSAFMLAAPGTTANVSAPATFVAAPADAPAADVTGSGTADFIPLWTTTSNIGNSTLFQSGTGNTSKIGINTTTPATTLDVKGGGTIRGTLSLPSTGTATATKGFNSQPLTMAGSAFSSTTNSAVIETFQFQVEPVDNGTSSSSASVNVLFGSGTEKPVETGLNIASNGQITFASGQTFPGTGTGTVTSVTGGAGLAGGTITGSGTLSIATGGVSNAMLANPSLTVAAGTDLTGGGLITLGGTTTLNLDTTKVPQLNAANTFTGNQTVSGNLTATGVVSGSSFEIGSSLFAFGSYANANALLGFAGNSTMTGVDNTASGYQALTLNTTGTNNTASGFEALSQNSTGNDNTASGERALSANTAGANNTAAGHHALENNTTASQNTADGDSALASNTLGTDNTATGYQALNSNTGDNLGLEDGDYNTADGVQALYANTLGAFNTATGYQALYSNRGDTLGVGDGSSNTAVAALALYSNTTGGINTAVGDLALQSNTTGVARTCIGVGCASSADGLRNATAIGAHAVVGASNSLVLGGTGQYAVKVGIGTATPSNVLTIAQGAGHPLSDGWDTFSSRRWKTNIQTLHGALEKVEQLRGVSYDLKTTGKHEVGVIAEEVGAVVPEVVSYEENGKDARGVDYSRLTALLIEATKEQQREFRQQQTELSRALRQINQQQELLRTQSAAMRSLKAEVRGTREALRKVKAQVGAAQPALVAAK